MAQIFVSHSQKDSEIIHFFLEAFAGTKVKPHFEEFEKDSPIGLGADKIREDIKASNALFVLLSENVESLGHTRDWISWECGSGQNLDIWIFEPLETLGRIRVVIPKLNHYVLYERTAEWRKYLQRIITSYDNSHVIPTLSAAAGAGALLNQDDRAGGAAVGFFLCLGALVLRDSFKPQLGIQVKCWSCQSNYRVHVNELFRCAVCNVRSRLAVPHSNQAALALNSKSSLAD